ncbi:SDR family NAD(P)-dependent oxidoreductase [Candidatus Microgenomates bacterium]|nr:SDR family NAD(P)-dependent oxidoreductase [Candidatus Microgenomates bacterium]
MSKYKNILVTGGAGFIGSFLVDELINKGYKVRILDNLEEQVHHGKKPTYLNKDAEFIKGDVTDYNIFKKALTGMDVVYHLAAAVGVAQSNYEIKKYVHSNVVGSANLADILANTKHSIKKVIFPASMTGFGEGNYNCKTHGIVRPPVRGEAQLKKNDFDMYCTKCKNVVLPVATEEEAQEYPSNIYAITKKSQQELLLLTGELYNIPTVAIRFFNIYGPRQSLSNPYTGVTAIFISRLKNNQVANVYEDGTQARDFLSVHDAARALILAMEKKSTDYQIINIASGKPTSIEKIARKVAELLGKPELIKVSGEFRKNDVKHCYAKTDKAKRILGFSPKITLQQGFKELIEWSKNEEAEDGFEKAQKELKKKGII